LTFSIGADPELFLGKGGQFVCAYGVIPGTKENPFPVDKGAIQVDGVAAEFNIDPAYSLAEFKKNLKTVCAALRGYTNGLQFLRKVTVEIDRNKVPEEALVIGCSSDLDPYTGEMNDSPDGETNFRSAGGHVHIGGFFDEGDDNVTKYVKSLKLAKLLDKNLGVYSLLWDKDTRRRQLYGKAGACRLKDFGLEYRCLSNQWLFSPALTNFVYRQVALSVYELRQGLDVQTSFFADIINKSDFDAAKAISYENRHQLPELVKEYYAV